MELELKHPCQRKFKAVLFTSHVASQVRCAYVIASIHIKAPARSKSYPYKRSNIKDILVGWLCRAVLVVAVVSRLVEQEFGVPVLN